MKPNEPTGAVPPAVSPGELAAALDRRRAVLTGAVPPRPVPPAPRIGIPDAARHDVPGPDLDGGAELTRRTDAVAATSDTLAAAARDFDEPDGAPTWPVVGLGAIAAIAAGTAVAALGVWLFTLGMGIDLSGLGS